MKEKFKIFFDMDGVLVDFKKGIEQKFGKDSHILSMSSSELSAQQKKKRDFMWKEIQKNPEFWLELNPIHDFKMLWNHFQDYERFILTAAPYQFIEGSVDFLKVSTMKQQWLLHHLEFNDFSRFICTIATRKHQFIQNNYHNVLFDDRTQNIANWRNNGGIGILHKNSDKSIKEFSQELNKLIEKQSSIKLGY
jgi:hypothetical protein